MEQISGGHWLEAELPKTKSGATTFNRLSVLFVNAADVIEADTDFVNISGSTANGSIAFKAGSTNTVVITLSAAMQTTLNGLAPGQYYVSIYGGWKEESFVDPVDTGRYFSMFRPLTVVP